MAARVLVAALVRQAPAVPPPRPARHSAPLTVGGGGAASGWQAAQNQGQAQDVDGQEAAEAHLRHGEPGQEGWCR